MHQDDSLSYFRNRAIPRVLVSPLPHWRDLLLALLAALLVLLADVVLLRTMHGSYVVPVGTYRDSYFVSDANDRQSDNGVPYRWTRARSTLWLHNLGDAPNPLLSLSLGGRPEPATVDVLVNDQPYTSFTAETTPRIIQLLLPPGLPAETRLDLVTSPLRSPGDPRELGVKLMRFQLNVPGTQVPGWPSYLAQVLVLLGTQITLVRLRWRWRWQVALLAGVALALAVVLRNEWLTVYAYLPRLAVAALALMLLTMLVLPPAEQVPWLGGAAEVRVLWSITLLACAIRLIGVLYPTFASQDTGLNMDRVYRVLNGQMVIIKSSFEFANGDTAHPPGIYLGMLPGALLFGDLPALMHGFTALLDGLTCLLIAMLVRRLGGNTHAARLAAVLYLGSYSAFSILGYGFQKHIFGQWFTTPIALVLLCADRPPQPRQWVFAAALLLISAFSHIGSTLLNFTWFACIGLLMVWAYRGVSRSWLVGAGLTALAGIAAFGLLYVSVFGISVSHASAAVGSERNGPLFPGADPLIIRGLLLGYTPWGTLLVPLGLWLVWRRGMLRDHVATIGWVLTVIIFLFVDLRTGLQTRYFFFALPLAFGCIGMVLGKLATTGRFAQIACWALVLATVLQNVALWYSVTFADGKISMTPLTH